MIAPTAAFALSAALFGLGMLGIFAYRHPLTVLLSLQLMFSAAVLALVSFDYTLAGTLQGGIPAALAHEAPGQSAGQSFGVFVLSICTAQFTVALGFLIAARREPRENGPGDANEGSGSGAATESAP